MREEIGNSEYGHSTKLSEISMSHAKSAFSKIYQPEAAKYSGRVGSSFPAYVTQLRLNQKACGLPDAGVLDLLHHTLKQKEAALSYFLSQVSTKVKTLSQALSLMEGEFFSDAAQMRAHDDFLALDFLLFRRSKEWKEESEAAVTAFEAHARALQQQLPSQYQDDMILRDRLVTAHNFSRRLKDAFIKKRPATSHEVTQRASARAGTIAHHDLLCGKEEIEVFYTDMGERHGSRRSGYGSRSFRRRNGRRKGPCWICEGPHFARQRHSEAEIKAARNKGKSVIAHCAELSPEVAEVVLQAELEEEENCSIFGQVTMIRAPDQRRKSRTRLM